MITKVFSSFMKLQSKFHLSLVTVSGLLSRNNSLMVMKSAVGTEMAKMSAANLLSCSPGFPDSVMIMANEAIQIPTIDREKSSTKFCRIIGGAEVRNSARMMNIPAGTPDLNNWFLEAFPERISGMSPNIKR